MVTYTIPLDDSVAQSIEAMAKRAGISIAEYAAQAIGHLVERQKYLDAVDAGIQQADANELIDANDVFSGLQAKLSAMTA